MSIDVFDRFLSINYKSSKKTFLMFTSSNSIKQVQSDKFKVTAKQLARITRTFFFKYQLINYSHMRHVSSPNSYHKPFCGKSNEFSGMQESSRTLTYIDCTC